MKTENRFVGFDTLKRAVSMVQVLERYGLMERLRRSGDNLSGPCPIHDGHNPSQFRVSMSRNCWICFGDCHRGGSIVDFVSGKEGVSVREAGLLIQDWFEVKLNGKGVVAGDRRNGSGVELPCTHVRTLQPATSNEPMRWTLSGLDSKHPYLATRGLTPETVAAFGIGYCRHGWLAGRIAIPIHNAVGELIAYAGRWVGQPSESEPRYQLPKGFRKSLELFNLHRIREADARLPLVIVEGFFGCMSVWQAGHRRVVSVMGSMLSQAQEQLIVRTVGPGGRVLLLFDEDEAGRKGRAEAFERLDQLLDVRVVSPGGEGSQPDNLPPEQLLGLLQWS